MNNKDDNKLFDHTCKSCGSKGTGNYCHNCGQSYETKRISVHGILHDVFHFFTHLEKGFGYTLKQLLLAPGAMQRAYIEGVRSRHQKPFSMFFICASVNALARYWIYGILLKYFHSGNPVEADFFHQYMVLLYALLLPVIAFLTKAIFSKSPYNYAEILVMHLYNFSFIFIAIVLVAMLKLIWRQLDTAYIDLPLLLLYSAITFSNFFNRSKKWLTVLKSVILMTVMFLVAQKLEDWVIGLIHKDLNSG